VRRLPYAHGTLLMALDEQLSPPEIIIIRGGMAAARTTTAERDELKSWQAAAQSGYAPRRITLAIPAQASGLPGSLAAMKASTEPRAYRCQGTQCAAPIEQLSILKR